ncbi:alkaline phosphatase family protein [Pontibacter sp. E15-1]|uniref:alkaline phosphatase PafA n=1 Tax=Pontibacter sp. E15-1 TaxID=2919918 RepID=UPI001F4F5F2D|nr:alkaline phosphatase PafA [Pontibacter sp. E15-1]MCJ8166129.1 alkaline phosphatase family protein [Pontibacter sp. E15-1]
MSQNKFFSNSMFVKAAAMCLLVLSACAGTPSATAPEASTASHAPDFSKGLPRPKLVVGLVVDQMRYDYLYRYWDKYGNDGFKKLLSQGFNFKNNQYSYVPTYTGPGHASIYTGSVPAINGIIGNNWYARGQQKMVYCVDDETVSTVGSTSTAGQMSPANLLTTTITDELRLATNMGSKVIGIALKDRGSILPAGHLGNAAYWFDSPSGNWITSTYYRNDLPQWVQEFNNSKYPDQHLSEVWNTLLPIEAYTESTADDVAWEETLPGEQKPVFPHNVPAIRGKDYELLRSLPAGNTITKDFALAALRGERLGKGDFTDFLAISFSSVDYIGHKFGPNSVEVEDALLRLDQEMGELIKAIEEEVGKGEVLFFLTADHGAAHVPAFLKEKNIPSGVTTQSVIRDSVEQYLNKQYGPGKWVEQYANQQLYLNHKLIDGKKLNLADVQQRVAAYVMRFESVMRAVSAGALQNSNWGQGLMARVENGYNAQRSGDVIVLLQPGWFEGWGSKNPKGTTHGSFSNYDTHVPLVWYGWRVQPGESSVATEIADIAPTIASWLYLQEPNGSVGRPLQEFMK